MSPLCFHLRSQIYMCSKIWDTKSVQSGSWIRGCRWRIMNRKVTRQTHESRANTKSAEHRRYGNLQTVTCRVLEYGNTWKVGNTMQLSDRSEGQRVDRNLRLSGVDLLLFTASRSVSQSHTSNRFFCNFVARKFRFSGNYRRNVGKLQCNSVFSRTSVKNRENIIKSLKIKTKIV